MSSWDHERFKLTGAQQEQLQRALLDAFPSISDLRQMVAFGLDEPLDEITGESNRRHAVFELIRWAMAQGRVAELILAARERVPRNPMLRAVADTLLLAVPMLAPPDADALAPVAPPATVSRLALEKVINQSAHFTNVDAFLSRMSEVVLTVCRVETPTSYGTGFLVGPDLVMTNYHVVQDIIHDQQQMRQVELRFDYRTDAQGRALRSGNIYHLDMARPMLSSPFLALDIALLPVDGRPGREEVGGQSGAPERKWLTPVVCTFEPGQPLFVVQHPAGEAMQVAFDVVIDATADRLRYRTNTRGGSSGSPCFNDRWELVAIHHAAGEEAQLTYNQGIPFSAILQRDDVRAALEQRLGD